MFGREVGDGGRGFGVDREEQASDNQTTKQNTALKLLSQRLLLYRITFASLN